MAAADKFRLADPSMDIVMQPEEVGSLGRRRKRERTGDGMNSEKARIGYRIDVSKTAYAGET